MRRIFRYLSTKKYLCSELLRLLTLEVVISKPTLGSPDKIHMSVPCHLSDFACATVAMALECDVCRSSHPVNARLPQVPQR